MPTHNTSRVSWKKTKRQRFCKPKSCLILWRNLYPCKFLRLLLKKNILNARIKIFLIQRFESALQQNLMFDAFDNDWLGLGDEMSSIGGPGDLHLKVWIKIFLSYFSSQCFYILMFKSRNINRSLIFTIARAKLSHACNGIRLWRESWPCHSLRTTRCTIDLTI